MLRGRPTSFYILYSEVNLPTATSVRCFTSAEHAPSPWACDPSYSTLSTVSSDSPRWETVPSWCGRRTSTVMSYSTLSTVSSDSPRWQTVPSWCGRRTSTVMSYSTLSTVSSDSPRWQTVPSWCGRRTSTVMRYSTLTIEASHSRQCSMSSTSWQVGGGRPLSWATRHWALSRVTRLDGKLYRVGVGGRTSTVMRYSTLSTVSSDSPRWETVPSWCGRRTFTVMSLAIRCHLI